MSSCLDSADLKKFRRKNPSSKQSPSPLLENTYFAFKMRSPIIQTPNMMRISRRQSHRFTLSPDNESFTARRIRGPPPQTTGAVWYCCQCHQGAYSVKINAHCPNCHIKRCVRCTVKSGTHPRAGWNQEWKISNKPPLVVLMYLQHCPWKHRNRWPVLADLGGNERRNRSSLGLLLTILLT